MTNPSRTNMQMHGLSAPESTDSGFVPIPKRQVPEEVARQIQHVIASRKLRAGDKLPTERELSAMLEAGRSAIREGLKLLAAVDIIEPRQGAGTYVKRIQSLVLRDASALSSEEQYSMLVKAQFARKVVDCAVAELAAQTISDAYLQEVRCYLQEADSDANLIRLAHTIDLTFEAMLGVATENEYLQSIQAETHRYFQSAWDSTGFMPRPAKARNEQHWAIFHAIEQRDTTLARVLMERHFELHSLDRKKQRK